MCGIIGFIGLDNLNVLIKMRDEMIHRGPDDYGYYFQKNNKLFLGHRRLSVIDSNGGKQPMWDNEEKICIIFNGEIYNHLNLRKSLESKGYIFQSSHSDTEVLIYGYKEWGNDLPKHLNGMFAFCIFDKIKNKLFLARDRFGEKPLFYYQNKNIFGFSSEIRTFKNSKIFNLNLNITNLQKFYAYGYFPPSKTLFKNVFKLKPGYFIDFDISNMKTKIKKYWDFKLNPDYSLLNSSIDKLSEEFFELLVQSTKRRLMSDVPLGFFLSGGLDSTSILASAKTINDNDKLNAFTIGFQEKTFDETEWANIASKNFNINHYLKYMTINDLIKNADQILNKNDIPIADPSLIPTFSLCKLASKKVKVALSGDGADEILAGYDPFLAIKPAQFYNKIIPRPVHSFILKLANCLPVSDNQLSFDFKIKKTLNALSYPKSFNCPIWMSILDPHEINDLFNTKISLEDLYSETIELFETHKSESPFENMLYFFTKFYLTDNILTKLDTASMANSLETRTVFLDNDIISFVEKLPLEFKIKNGNRKYILKKAVENSVPNKIISRKKKGFGVPLSPWILNKSNDILNNKTIYNKNKIEELIEEHKKSQKDNSRPLFGMLSLNKLIK